ncbi:MAG: sigma-70 family RNA polymerase sigma factor [Acidobacteriia bacterium]|nr:sigma-70 family RNA polymerase sigma factor [Terriglobia bacterium]
MPDAGKNAEFEALALPLFDSLYNFAHWLAQDRQDAEDLVQETYAKALKGFGSFRPGTNFRAWMFKILRNTFLTSRAGLSYANSMPLEPGDEERLPPATSHTPETLVITQDLGEALQQAIEALPVPFREVLLLADVEEMSYRDISETLSIPIGTVMSRLARARKAARQKLIEFGYEQKKGTASRR